jgi:site-specific DNA-methyltransferase (adenine-specific)
MQFKADHADALDWLPTIQSQSAKIVVFDPPYAVGTPVRGKEDGAAGSVFGPLSFMSKALTQCSRIVMPGGVVVIFADWRRMPDLAYVATTVGLRASTCIAWTRKRPGTGGMFRSAWDPILIASRGVADAIDRAAIRNVIEADYPTKRIHPYEKPAEVFRHIFPRISVPGDLVVDPFAGSGVSARVARELGLNWIGCDVDPQFAQEAS